MATLRDIRQKIQGIKSTQQITKAMKMMSTGKLHRGLERLKEAHFYLGKLEQMMADLASQTGELSQTTFLPHKKVETLGVVLITGNRGLCGSFNSELCKCAEQLIKQHNLPQTKLMLVGRKGYEFFRRKPYPIIGYYPELVGTFQGPELRAISRKAIGLFQAMEIDKLVLVYSTYVSALEHYVVKKVLLPLEDPQIQKGEKKRRPREVELSPDPQTIFQALVPRFVDGQFQKAILETSVSEESARMIAMTSATERAEEMLEDLHLVFHRTRQSVITREIVEVTSGAEALNE